MKYKIYIGGFQEMDLAYSPPHLLGSVEAKSFKEACDSHFSGDEHKMYFRKEECRYWALRLGPTVASVCDDYPLEQWFRDIES